MQGVANCCNSYLLIKMFEFELGNDILNIIYYELVICVSCGVMDNDMVD